MTVEECIRRKQIYNSLINGKECLDIEDISDDEKVAAIKLAFLRSYAIECLNIADLKEKRGE